ncbi:MAG: hypothetical protein AB8A46_02345 [Prochlorococcus sp.]|nr:MAG: Uncharacterised protein [Prochlorococcus marinus str. MIT 9215]
MFVLRQINLHLGLIALLLSLTSSTSALAEKIHYENPIIFKLCIIGFNAAMADAEKTPPSGMGEYTCNCFLEQMDNGETIDSAQKICENKAASHYNIL